MYFINFEKGDWKVHKVNEENIIFDGYSLDSKKNKYKAFRIITNPPLAYNIYLLRVGGQLESIISFFILYKQVVRARRPAYPPI